MRRGEQLFLTAALLFSSLHLAGCAPVEPSGNRSNSNSANSPVPGETFTPNPTPSPTLAENTPTPQSTKAPDLTATAGEYATQTAAYQTATPIEATKQSAIATIEANHITQNKEWSQIGSLADSMVIYRDSYGKCSGTSIKQIDIPIPGTNKSDTLDIVMLASHCMLLEDGQFVYNVVNKGAPVSLINAKSYTTGNWVSLTAIDWIADNTVPYVDIQIAYLGVLGKPDDFKNLPPTGEDALAPFTNDTNQQCYLAGIPLKAINKPVIDVILNPSLPATPVPGVMEGSTLNSDEGLSGGQFDCGESASTMKINGVFQYKHLTQPEVAGVSVLPDNFQDTLNTAEKTLVTEAQDYVANQGK